MRPAKLKILGKPFLIQWLTEGLDPDLVGECDSDGQVIRVRDGQPPEQERDTLLHEITHAVDEAMGTNLKEAQVRKIATGLLAVFLDNPRLMSYLRRKNNNAYPKALPRGDATGN
jgi:hypothetical protein